MFVTPTLCSSHKLNCLSALIKRMIKLCESFKYGVLSGKRDFSVQLSMFSGNGERYVKHIDSTLTGASRKLTMIFYLNEVVEGGSLRIYNNDSEYYDVEPQLGRLVLFRR